MPLRPRKEHHKEASNLETEKAHLSGALQQNGYPAAFVRAASQESKPQERDPEEAQGEGKPTLMMLPYVAGVSERIRKACRNYNIKVVFRSGPTFRSMLIKVKDPLPIEKQERACTGGASPSACSRETSSRASVGDPARKGRHG